MNAALPRRRLLVRAGGSLLTLDLTQIHVVGGVPDQRSINLARVLRLPGGGVAHALLAVETGREEVEVGVEEVGGVVEVAAQDVLPLPATVRLTAPGLVRAVLLVPEPGAWRRASLLPTPVSDLDPVSTGTGLLLAADLDPVRLGQVLLAAKIDQEKPAP